MGLLNFLGRFRREEPMPEPEPEADLDGMPEDEVWSRFDEKFRDLIDNPALPEHLRQRMLDALPEAERNARVR